MPESMIVDRLEQKQERLMEILRELSSGSRLSAEHGGAEECSTAGRGIAVAFSGGVDSTYLLDAAVEALGDHAFAVTAVASFFPERERDEARTFCAKRGIRQYFINVDGADIEGFCDNPPDRCYRCKKVLFSRMIELARSRGAAAVVEGSNMDDNSDYRPGMAAVRELGIASPLQEALLYKEEIRELSRRRGLATAAKPSVACLASRFVYGEAITPEKLCMVDRAEQYLQDHGFPQVRVRVHGDMARIEVPRSRVADLALRAADDGIAAQLKKIGFSYVALDLEGYRTGSMNEGLSE